VLVGPRHFAKSVLWLQGPGEHDLIRFREYQDLMQLQDWWATHLVINLVFSICLVEKSMLVMEFLWLSNPGESNTLATRCICAASGIIFYNFYNYVRITLYILHFKPWK